MRRKILLASGLAVLCSAAFLLVLQQRPADKPVKPADAITYSVPTPAETNVNSDYVVPNNQPLQIEITNRNIKGYIQRVGVDQNKAVAAPNKVHLAGWFVDSALPGRKGLSIIDGHVDGVSQQGVFHNLSTAITGDTITITNGDASTATYRVFSSKTIQTADATKYLFDQDPLVTSQLNIITCSGTYNAKVQSYDKRIIVSAKLL